MYVHFLLPLHQICSTVGLFPTFICDMLPSLTHLDWIKGLHSASHLCFLFLLFYQVLIFPSVLRLSFSVSIIPL